MFLRKTAEKNDYGASGSWGSLRLLRVHFDDRVSEHDPSRVTHRVSDEFQLDANPPACVIVKGYEALYRFDNIPNDVRAPRIAAPTTRMNARRRFSPPTRTSVFPA